MLCNALMKWTIDHVILVAWNEFFCNLPVWHPRKVIMSKFGNVFHSLGLSLIDRTITMSAGSEVTLPEKHYKNARVTIHEKGVMNRKNHKGLRVVQCQLTTNKHNICRGIHIGNLYNSTGNVCCCSQNGILHALLVLYDKYHSGLCSSNVTALVMFTLIIINQSKQTKFDFWFPIHQTKKRRLLLRHQGVNSITTQLHIWHSWWCFSF